MPNRLASETSPYLLQHAHNPVDWYPWCDEALALARDHDRPILLSIGYSACHWCHVMERESFEDDETAALMNRSFVNIKVDREERPDVDSIYMRAVQAMTGHGGWPLTAFLTPAGVPYYGGTYFPPEPRHGMPSFRQVLAAAANAYHSRRDEVARAGAQLTEVLGRSATEPQPASGPFDLSDGRLFAHAVSAAGRTFDPTNGGFGGAPKFPQPDFLDFLLRTGGPESHGVSMASHTLSRMAAGGIRDHAGGGFHRYSVDARWLVPHFEKMLYDNALIARALTRAHLLGARHLGAVAEETLDYVLEDLTSPEGVFHSARDADSEGEEGLFYLWTPAQVAAVLGRDEARLLSRVYDVSEAGNFEGRNILHLPHDLDAVARQEGVGRVELDGRLRDSLAALKDHRAARPEPLRDEKVLTSWNGFTIRALAEAGPALGRPDYTAAGARAASFLLHTMRRGDRLLRVFAAGRAHIDGFLEDYGALGNACLSLYEATLEARWLTEASWIADAVVAHFWSPAEQLFHDAPADGEALVVRPRDIMDNATPSGNSLAVELLVRLAATTGSAAHGEIAEAVFARERGTMERYPSAVGRLLTAAVQHATPRLEITLVGSPPSLSGMLDVAHRHPHPNRVIAGGDPEDPAVAALPAMEGRLDRAGQAFVCVGTTCREPVSTPQALDAALTRAQSDSPAG
ncbi:MAG: thioredoxin domain-containing protein [Gemmatimonadota bacterium]|nr:thioredoxin domain-containing protein [Gemmatimonadota bacterium]MDE2984217.1 thioredoxin domain-containing protein [Gemmatimonadota bacterium]